MGVEVVDDEVPEFAAGEALVTVDDLAGVDEVVVLFQACPGCFAFGEYGLVVRHVRALGTACFSQAVLVKNSQTLSLTGIQLGSGTKAACPAVSI